MIGGGECAKRGGRKGCVCSSMIVPLAAVLGGWTGLALRRFHVELCPLSCRFWDMKSLLSVPCVFGSVECFVLRNFYEVERFEDVRAVRCLTSAKSLDLGFTTSTDHLWDGSDGDCVLDLRLLRYLERITIRDERSRIRFKARGEDSGTSRIQLLLRNSSSSGSSLRRVVRPE